MFKISLKRRQCNCCRLNDECQAHRVTLRAAKQIPECISPEPQKTFCEEQNIDIKVKDYAEYLSKQTALYLLGEKKGGISYDTFMRTTWNYGKLNPVR